LHSTSKFYRQAWPVFAGNLISDHHNKFYLRLSQPKVLLERSGWCFQTTRMQNISAPTWWAHELLTRRNAAIVWATHGTHEESMQSFIVNS